MTIKECRRRKRIFRELINKLAHNDDTNLTMEQIDCITLALRRSVTIEDLNINKLKENKNAVGGEKVEKKTE